MLNHWRQSLSLFLKWFEGKRTHSRFFLFKLFLFFMVLNLASYWWALLTTYPQHLSSYKAIEYQLMGGPVSFMGSAFDSFSLFITVWMVRRAVNTKHTAAYFAYLSVDLLIAVVATFWVLFAFVFSGWLVNLVLENPETFNQRTSLYEWRIWNALSNPLAEDNIKNVYFGILMGASALLPTLVHLYMAGMVALKWAVKGFSKVARTS